MSIRHRSAPFRLVFVLCVALLAPAAALAGASGGSELTVAHLLRLVEQGVGEELLTELVEKKGFVSSFEVAEVVALKEKGLSDAFISMLLAEARGTSPVEDVSFEEVDGVIVVTGQGEPDDESAEDHYPVADGQPPVLASPLPPQVVVVNPAAPVASEPVESSNAFPVGASFGYSGGAAFIPAHFGDPPSNFGRTIVATTPVALGYGTTVPVHVPVTTRHHHDVRSGHGALYHPGPLALGSFSTGHVSRPHRVPGTGTIGIRTSRGTIRVPN